MVIRQGELDESGRPRDPGLRRIIDDIIESPAQRIARDAARLGLTPNLAGALGAAERSLADTMRELSGWTALGAFRDDMARRLLPAAGLLEDPLEQALRRIRETFGAADAARVQALIGGADVASRTAHWARALAPVGTDRLAELVAGAGADGGGALQPIVRRELERIARDADVLASGGALADREIARAKLGLVRPLLDGLEPTALRMALVAGARDTVGSDAAASRAAYDALLGEWRTHPGLPDRFWRDPVFRRRRYRAAHVDPGLIEADAAATLGVMVESGLLAGAVTEAGTAAIVEAGPVKMTIVSLDRDVDAFRAVNAFERSLRAYIAARLEPLAGEDWFKTRTPPGLLAKAKATRLAARRRGEPHAPLIQFVDLGDLIGIVTRADNWEQAFGPAFVNRQEFELDMQRLVASRRPTMHARRVDGVRLVELICVIHRLSAQMEDGGAWASDCASDR